MKMEKVFLFTPGNSEEKIKKALGLDTDALILDLEDAVVTEEKDKARKIVYDTLNSLSDEASTPKIYVRINPINTPYFHEDIYMVKNIENIAGIMIPKSDDKTSVTIAADLLGREIEIIPLIESASGVYNIESIIQSDRNVRRVAFGSVDFALDIGVDWSEEGLERTYAMSKIALTSRALRAEAPIDAVFPVINDKEKFIVDTIKGKQVGFYGKMIIHPKHIDWVREVYSPNEKQVKWSEKVVEVFEHGEHNGAIDLNGKLIDRPVYLLAKRILAAR